MFTLTIIKIEEYKLYLDNHEFTKINQEIQKYTGLIEKYKIQEQDNLSRLDEIKKSGKNYIYIKDGLMDEEDGNPSLLIDLNQAKENLQQTREQMEKYKLQLYNLEQKKKMVEEKILSNNLNSI